jgi:sugar lactone lactonase YvrE
MSTLSGNGGRRWLGAAVLVIGMVLLIVGLVVLSPAVAADGAPATLTVMKETNPDGGTGFPFTLRSEGPTLMIGNVVPHGIATDAAGNFYVGEWSNHRVQKFNAAGDFLMAWGWDVVSSNTYIGFEVCLPTDTCKAGVSGSGNGQFKYPAGVAIDAADNIYVVDANNFRVQKFSANGAYLRQWGGYGTAGGQFNGPRHVAIDAAGAVYVADYFNHRIQKFDADGNFLLAWGWDVVSGNGNYGFEVCTQANTCKAGIGGGGKGQFYNPYGIAVDPVGNIYVSDRSNHRIQKFDAAGTFLLAWGWDVVSDNGNTVFEVCTPSDTCKAGVSGTGNGQYNGPFGLAFDGAGNLYVGEDTNHRIQKTDATGGYLRQWGSRGTEPGKFNTPSGIAVGPTGAVYVADINNYRIQKFVDSAFTLSDDGSVTYALDPTTFKLDEVGQPDWNLEEIACDGGNPQVSGSEVTVTLAAGDDVTCTFTNSAPNEPPAAADDAYSTDEGQELTVAAPGVLGNDSDPDNDPLTAVLFDDVDHGALTLNSDGSFTYMPAAGYSGPDSFTYMANDGSADSNVATVDITVNRITATLTIAKETNPDGGGGFPFTAIGHLGMWGSLGNGEGQFNYPRGVAVDNAGNVYVTNRDNHRVQKFSPDGSQVLAVWPSYLPFDVAVDSEDNVYVVDYSGPYGPGIKKYDSNGNFLFAWGDARATSIAIDKDDRVYVAEAARIRVFNTDGTFLRAWGWDVVAGGGIEFEVCTVAAECQSGVQGSGAGQFNISHGNFRGVTVDGDGNVYVADTGNHRIQKFTSEGDFVTMWGSYATGLNNPRGIDVDGDGNVYVADTGNNRIQKFDSDGSFVLMWNSPSGQTRGVTVDGAGRLIAPNGWDRIEVFDDDTVTLDDDESVLFTVRPGTYDIREILPPGWAVTNITCTGGNPQAIVDRVTVTLTAGEDIICTFTDTSTYKPPVPPATLMLIKETDPDGGTRFPFTVVGQVGGWGVFGHDPGQFYGASGVALDKAGNVYVADLHNSRIQKFSTDGSPGAGGVGLVPSV